MVCALIIIFFFCSWLTKKRDYIAALLWSYLLGYQAACEAVPRATAMSLSQLWLWTGCKDLGFVVAGAVSDPGPCCCDWLHGGGWRASVKPWQSGSGRRYWVGACGTQTCAQSEAGGVTAAFPNGALWTVAGQSWLEVLEGNTEKKVHCHVAAAINYTGD